MIKLLKKLIPKKINQLVYLHETGNYFPTLEAKFDEENSKISISEGKNKTSFDLFINETHVHRSNVIFDVHLMKALNAYKAPVIGDCWTIESYRGLSIYPYMLQKITSQLLKQHKKVYMLVAPENIPSIKGIEKAGFIKKCEIKTLRVGFFYLFTKIST